MTVDSLGKPESSVGNNSVEQQGVKNPYIVDLGFVFRGMLACKWFILIFAVIGFVMGVRNLKNYSPSFEASMVVSPSAGTVSGRTNSGSGLSSVAKSFGIKVSGVQSTASNFDRLRFTIGSIPLVRVLEEKHHIIRRMFAGAWDSETKNWRVPEGKRFNFEQKIRKRLHLATWQAPSIEGFAEYLKSVIVVEEMVGVPFLKITYRHSDRMTARWFLETVYSEADNLLRRQDQDRAKLRKLYIQGSITETSIVEQRQMLLSMLASEEQRLMLLASDLAYAAEIVEPVFVSSTPTVPSLLKDFGAVIFSWVLASVALSLIFVLVRAEKA